MWVANSATLLHGERDAVLVDTFLTIDHSRALAEWVAASGKNLTTIYITHAHGDHFFGTSLVLERFPHARVVATSAVVKGMQQQLLPQMLDGFWRARFPGQIAERLVLAEDLDGREVELEGNPLVPVAIGFTDTADTTCLHVPSVALVVAGDAVYNGIHPYLAETTRATRHQWLAALDQIEALRPAAVIAGHKIPENDDDPKHIEATRRYLHDFIRLEESAGSARQLYDEMLALYPDRANPGSLWSAAVAAKPNDRPV
jgi:glyoxylase-like metal-dependent hydrolase (beta-lactamase superfamily II)